MKKILTVLFVALLLCGCATNNKEVINNDEPTTLANPMVEYSSLDEINKKVGVSIVSPGVMGKENEKYFVIADKIAQYDFDLNGYSWTIRGAINTEEDISGIYDENNIFEPGQSYGMYTNDFYLDRFFDGSKQYTIVLTGEGVETYSEEDFSNICLELELIMKWHRDDPIVGDYEEINNPNTYLYVERVEDEYALNINVNVSDLESYTYSMNATKQDNKLVYGGETIGHYVYDENYELITDEETAVNYLGSFEIQDNKLLWNNASDEALRDYTFEKIIYEE